MEKQEISTTVLIVTSKNSSFGDNLLMKIFSILPVKSFFRFKRPLRVIRDKIMEKQENSSNELIGFGDDLLMEIFSRLPVESIVRFKCTSKEWHNLISNDSFQKSLTMTMSGLFYKTLEFYPKTVDEPKESIFAQISDGNSISEISLSFLPFYHNFIIINCCNGLILGRLCDKGGGRYHVCNPLTKEWVALPELYKLTYTMREKNKRVFIDINAKLAYDPAISPHYKVIFLWPYRDDNYISLDIFFSDSGKWVKSKMFCDIYNVFPMDSKHDVFLDGTLYMVAKNSKRYCMVGMDLKEETCRRIEFPMGEDNYGLLGTCRGCLHYAKCDNSRLRIWMLKDRYSSEWVLKHETSMKSLVEKLSKPFCYHSYHHPSFYPIGFHPDIEIFLLASCRELYSYNFVSRRLEEICSAGCDKDSKNCQSFTVFPFTPCLKSLKKATS
ncbi:F-box protein At5g07610-like [Tasmannia lanceolata]|uniref:F-box protein At5g07610-like n=1 Tax=Tasmannia lanceolata TaxID=3420 RepID=UPI00406282EB